MEKIRARAFLSEGQVFYKCLSCGGVYPTREQAENAMENPGYVRGHKCNSRPKKGSWFWRSLLIET